MVLPVEVEPDVAGQYLVLLVQVDDLLQPRYANLMNYAYTRLGKVWNCHDNVTVLRFSLESFVLFHLYMTSAIVFFMACTLT